MYDRLQKLSSNIKYITLLYISSSEHKIENYDLQSREIDSQKQITQYNYDFTRPIEKWKESYLTFGK